MLKSFEAVASQLKFKSKVFSIDNLAFKFHYRATFIILLVCTVLVTSRQYIGEHIRCMTGGAPTIPEHVINTFCFFTTTFTIVRHLNETMLEKGNIPHPGIGPVYHDDEKKFHAYYQWVPFVLFGQAIMFYLPHFLWRSWENGRIKMLVYGLQMTSLSWHIHCDNDVQFSPNLTVQSRATVAKRVDIIRLEFLRHLRINRWWAPKLIFCEFLCFANLILQIHYVNIFLNGQFLGLGIKFIKGNFEGPMDPLDVVFPKVTKCHFYKYGASGSIQKHDALCVMALNVMNEKIYTFLWFWFIVLLAVTLASFTWRFLTWILHSRSTKFNGFIFSMACPGRLHPMDMAVIKKTLIFSDWLFLYYIAKNLDPPVFRELLSSLVIELRGDVFREVSDDEMEEVELRRRPSDGDPVKMMMIHQMDMESIDTVDNTEKSAKLA
ncbi:innexin inx7 [Lutzomyia longipalpis]|uniref:Innexin n=1 Tax=Lutzomyia longipalpis TaxID=7200 RepID=A0A1B0CW53_LUTLO|nr:innexin inx7 [Lutzomyia longipalpis]